MHHPRKNGRCPSLHAPVHHPKCCTLISMDREVPARRNCPHPVVHALCRRRVRHRVHHHICIWKMSPHRLCRGDRNLLRAAGTSGFLASPPSHRQRSSAPEPSRPQPVDWTAHLGIALFKSRSICNRVCPGSSSPPCMGSRIQQRIDRPPRKVPAHRQNDPRDHQRRRRIAVFQPRCSPNRCPANQKAPAPPAPPASRPHIRRKSAPHRPP